MPINGTPPPEAANEATPEDLDAYLRHQLTSHATAVERMMREARIKYSAASPDAIPSKVRLALAERRIAALEMLVWRCIGTLASVDMTAQPTDGAEH